MLQTIEVHIDNHGMIYPIEPQIKLPIGRALLTLLDDTFVKQAEPLESDSSFDDLFGIFTATRTATLEDMQQAIYQRAKERFNDCD